MTSVYVNDAREDWVCDRFASEWRASANVTHVTDPTNADVVWLLAGWCWRNIPPAVLERERVVCTVHHIDDSKFDAVEFAVRDRYVTCYHVPCTRTETQLRLHTDKPIHVIPFWVNDDIWYNYPSDTCRTLGIDCIHGDRYVIGSFQRDTEGAGIEYGVFEPKFSKGPHIFCDVVEHIARTQPVHVFLAGWRRQYVMRRLDAAGIPYTYFDRPDFKTVNLLYNSLDLYIVGSLVEGGPQALVECAATRTPIISTPVGFAEDIVGNAVFKLSFDSDGAVPIFESVDAAIDSIDSSANFTRVKPLFISNGGMTPFEIMFDSIR